MKMNNLLNYSSALSSNATLSISATNSINSFSCWFWRASNASTPCNRTSLGANKSAVSSPLCCLFLIPEWGNLNWFPPPCFSTWRKTSCSCAYARSIFSLGCPSYWAKTDWCNASKVFGIASDHFCILLHAVKQRKVQHIKIWRLSGLWDNFNKQRGRCTSF